jgi:cell division septal protein FtsQ
MREQRVSPINALLWILGSILLISGAVFFSLHLFQKWQNVRRNQPKYRITSIVQTGLQNNALTTEYLCELMGLSVDHPISIFDFNVKEAVHALEASPVIKEAFVSIIKPNSVYVDYALRKPLAWIYEYENTAIDEEGYLFPVYPFFSPKELPELYLGLEPFDVSPQDHDLPMGRWGVPLSSKYMKIGIDLLQKLNYLNVYRIDVSKAYAPTLGSREIVLYFEDEVLSKSKLKEHLCVFPRLVRMSTKNYEKELQRYQELRTELLEKEKMTIDFSGSAPYFKLFPLKVVDLRIDGMGFIETKKESGKSI